MPLIVAMMAGAVATLGSAGSNARAEAACAAPAPAVGAHVSGSVLQVMDGQTLCIALGPTPAQWLRVQLPEAASGGRAALMDAVFARGMSCVVTASAANGGVAARCAREAAPAETRHTSVQRDHANSLCLAAD